MSDNEVTIIDPAPTQAPTQAPAPASRQPASAPSTPFRPKRKARALPDRQAASKRASKKEALDPPGAPRERRSTIFLVEPPSVARPKTPAANPRRGPASAPVLSAQTSEPLEAPPTLDSAPADPGSVFRPVPFRVFPARPVDPAPRPSTDQPTDLPATGSTQGPEPTATPGPAPGPAATPATGADPLAPAPTPAVAEHEPTAREWTTIRAEMAEMRALILGLRAPPNFPPTVDLVASGTQVALGPIQADPFNIIPLRTAPNSRNDMPPASVCHLSSARFPPGKKSSTEYHPPQVHSLAAHRLFKDLGYPPFEGRYSSPTSFVLALLESPCFKFKKSVPTTVALYSGRLASRGASVMMFTESIDDDDLARGSTNENFEINFNLPLDPRPACESYDHLLCALNGLNSIANEMWHDHGRKLVSRLRQFVAKNKSADPHGTEERVKLTCHFVNKFLGRAVGWLQNESDQRWSLYCDELRTIDYAGPEWSMAVLNSMATTIRRETTRASSAHRRAEPGRPTARDQPRGGAAKRPTRMPDNIKSLIPRNANGEEPCLRHFSGAGCPGRDGGCTNKCLVHKWPMRLPTLLLDWARANMKRPDDANHASA